jgi:hypothetical protein
MSEAEKPFRVVIDEDVMQDIDALPPEAKADLMEQIKQAFAKFNETGDPADLPGERITAADLDPEEWAELQRRRATHRNQQLPPVN